MSKATITKTKLSTRSTYAALACVLAFVSAHPVHAERTDDTELYFDVNTDVDDEIVDPNVIFIFDTSGSMAGDIPVDVALGTYVGSTGEDDGEVACTSSPNYDENCDYGTSDDNYVFMYTLDGTNMTYNNVSVHDNQNACQAMKNFFTVSPGNPIFSDRIRQWRQNSRGRYNWRNNPQNSDADAARVLECQDDNGVHGRYTSSTEKYADRGNCTGSCPARYSTNPNDAPNWNRTYTFVPANYHDYLLCIAGGTCGTGSGGGSGSGTTTFSVSGVSIEQYQVIGFGPFMVSGGTNLDALVTTSDNIDLWVREDSLPDYDSYGCRDTDGTIDCTESVSGDSAVYVAVATSSFSGGTFDLTVDYTASGATAPTITNDSCQCENTGRHYFSSSNYCSWDNAWVNDGGSRTICDEKIDLMKDATEALVEGITNANVGMMRFNGGSGGYIIEAVGDVDAGSHRADLTAGIDAFVAGGSTPLTETLYESYLYLSGGVEDYGYVGSATDDDAFVGGTASSGGTYLSPIDDQCESNHVVLLTDGQPTSDTGANSEINALPGVSCSTSGGLADGGSSCLDELAGYMSQNEVKSDVDNSTVTTHTVGFDVDSTLQSFLEVVAQAGGGASYEVDSADSILNAFQSIILSIFTGASTFVAPAVTVNAFNQLQHRDEIYFAIFEPDSGPRWQGNVKKFKIEADGDVIDSANNTAVDTATGFFKDTAKSFWSSAPDGSSVTFGGMSEQMPVSRTVYTYMNDAPNNSTAVSLTTSLVTAADLGVNGTQPSSSEDDDYKDLIVTWALGGDEFGNSDYDDGGAHFIGDPLHARPFVITYGGTESNPIDRLFALTNTGFLHVVNPADTSGVEQWAFIPNDLLPNLRRYADPDDADNGKAYGLDGSVEPWINDIDGDGLTGSELASGDFVRLYFGMRRGGTNIYALDVTAIAGPPKLMWQINGADIPNDYEYEDVSTQNAIDATADTGFEDLGQTWSRARRTQVYWDCPADAGGDGVCSPSDIKDVLVFTGGYDPRHDENTMTDPDTEITDVPEYGNAIYMVDAVTGDLLWSAGNNSDSRVGGGSGGLGHDLALGFDHSFPASPGFVDIDADGLVDIIIAVDITGDVWRIDVSDTTTGAGDFATGGKIYSLGESGQFLRFFNQPDIVLTAPPRIGRLHQYYFRFRLPREPQKRRSGRSDLCVVRGQPVCRADRFRR